MAVLTGIRCAYMGGILAGGVSAIVTTKTIARDVCVVENSRHPQGAQVAVVALLV